MATDRLRCGIIGTGVWGETHLKAYSYDPQVELVCICDTNEQLLAGRSEQYQVAETTTDYRDLLARDDIDAVSVVTPDFLHREIVVAAAEAGKHVLVEKPMATTVAECEEMIAAAEESGVTLMIDFHNRWNPLITEIKSRLDAGSLGDPLMLTLRLNDTKYVPTQMLSWGGQSTVAWFLASHAADLARWLLQSEVKRVYSVSRSVVLKSEGYDTPDFFHSILEYESGAVCHIENCWIMSESMAAVCDFRGELIASEGSCILNVIANRGLEVYENQAGASMPVPIAMAEVHGQLRGFAVESIRHFARCVREGTQPLVKPLDGLRNTETVVAIHESARTGQPVEM